MKESALVFRWAREGLLSNIGGLMAKGAYGPLKSTIPPMTCPAWTSSMTGVDIHKHGLYDFFLSADLVKRKLYFADARKRKAKPVWRFLNEEGKRTVVVNLPVTYPPEEVDGAMVSGMLTPSPRSPFTYPPGLKEELLDMGYVIDIGETLLEKVVLFKRDPRAYLREVLEMVVKRTEACLYLMEQFEWDFFLVVFVALDRVNHLFWRYLDPGHVAYDPARVKPILPWVMRCYKAVDEAVGQLVKKAGPKTDVIIYSDHGFKALNYFAFFNNLLRRKGLLSIRGKSPSPLPTQDLFLKLARWLPITPLSSLLPAPLRRTIGHLMRGSKDFLSLFDIDPEGTLAFQLGQFIHVNERAVSSEEERAEVVKKVLRALREVYPLTRIRAYAREELYGREAQVPDVVLLAEGHVSPRHLLTIGEELLRRYEEDVEIPSLMWCGTHDLYGTLVVAGPSFRPVGRLKGARIMDIAPTILKLLGVEVPSYMDGRPLI